MHNHYSHSHAHSHAHHHKNWKWMQTAFWLNAFFTIFEFIGGLFANSTAILSDAIHDLGDTLALGIAILLEKISKKTPTKAYTYGFKRLSVLSAILLSSILAISSLFIIWESIQNFFEPKIVDEKLMFLFAIMGIWVNGMWFFKIYKEQKKKNNNSKAIMFHLLEDVLGWVAVLIGSVIIYFTNWYWIDSFLSICIALFILTKALPNLKDCLKIFLQSTPEWVSLQKIEQEILELPFIKNIHNLHIWTVDGNENIASIHVIMNKIVPQDNREILEKVTKILEKNNIHHSTVQFENQNSVCSLQEKSCN